MKGQAWKTEVYKCEDNNNTDLRARNRIGVGFGMY
jgi:hypothetical protein